ncbi:Lysophospholipase, alpha-beta hydrolase superfamily [Dethiosulfatibacter aminovorans DSM 17477]|uniref:Lysophospholipase, alpha-beta hydrolase superfamily n=1 Tax=Dethiosulfatibacter aminovorans DSM 17477 TaxID=1121476 RepID=A0A1M6M997_9FIRM|nr:alpha/beta hydrolase [Dethiosulfatibacter aminovorans]SHJ79863.1 Lysophospholipase, alpha-beta hydrolase superfamily [Dethiosulfatibacter aminovorans DSM 17477]
MTGKEFEVKTKDNLVLACRKNEVENPKAVFVIVHGFAEHMGRYEYLVKKMNEDGISTYRFDNRGHGKSQGKRGHLENYMDLVTDADGIVDVARDENPGKPIYMMGHSMGGFITLLYGITYPDKLKGQVLSGAASYYNDELKGLKGRFMKLANNIKPDFYIKNDLSENLSRDPDVVNRYRNDELCFDKATAGFYYQFLVSGTDYLVKNLSKYEYSCLILHGGNDKIIPKEASVNLYESISSIDKSIKIYPGLYHEIFNEKERDEVIDHLLKWINERVE